MSFVEDGLLSARTPPTAQYSISDHWSTNNTTYLNKLLAKRKASYAAIDEHVDESTQIIGIGIIMYLQNPSDITVKFNVKKGSGSTVIFCVERLAQRFKSESLNIRACIPTSFQATQLILEAGLPLAELNAHPVIDVAFDGADEIDPSLNCIKGGGGCHLQEKLVAAAAKKFVIVADYNKDSPALGTKWTKGIPVEVIPMAYVTIQNKIKTLKGKSALRMGAPAKAGPAVTDSGNLILDVFMSNLKGDNAVLETSQILKMIPGVVETGLFVGMAGWAYIGLEDGWVFNQIFIFVHFLAQLIKEI
ncbi:hypothetical protein HK100_000501 [Physocladia obscura]|uniref:Ribose-5-phosphate isomerase n=1 Tax=Physocladia obscura TaxID=109957 RepID=A0AAD5T8R4_9FUNG|nr:hypothetical protein HK100_000501 [Physocladia obscura]